MCEICGRYYCMPSCPSFMGRRIGDGRPMGDVSDGTGAAIRSDTNSYAKRDGPSELRKSEIERRKKCRINH